MFADAASASTPITGERRQLNFSVAIAARESPWPDIIGPTSHYFYSQRLKLHYVDWGNTDKPMAILVHGGRDHCRNWDWVALELRRHFHLIAPDLRGHGDSDWAIGGSYAMIDHVLDLYQLMNAIAGGPVTLIGHSLGAGVALQAAGVFPDSVKATGRDRGPGAALGDAA